MANAAAGDTGEEYSWQADGRGPVAT